MIGKLVKEIVERQEAITAELSDPAIFDDQSRYAEVSKAHSDLADAYRLAVEYQAAEVSVAEADVMLKEADLDPDMRDFIQEERQQALDDLERLAEEIRLATIEKDPRDEKNAIVEVRAGAGGDGAGDACELQPGGSREVFAFCSVGGGGVER